MKYWEQPKDGAKEEGKKSLSYGLSHSFEEKETISYCGSDILNIEAEMSFSLVATCEQITHLYLVLKPAANK